jgi:hypothetical protein
MTTDDRRIPLSAAKEPMTDYDVDMEGHSKAAGWGLGSRSGTLWVVLFILGCGAALLYILLQMRFPLAVLYDCPRTNLDKLTRVEATPPQLPLRFYDCPNYPLDNLTRPHIPTGLALLAGTLLLFGGYALGALALRPPTTDHRPPITPSTRLRAGDHRSNTRHATHRLGRWLTTLALVGFPLLFLALLLRVYPATSVDLYDYLFRGRMLARYSANTFVHVPQDFYTDALFDYAAWRRAVTAYGPLWEGLSWLTARLAGERPGAPMMSAPFISPGLGTVFSGYTPAALAELLRLMLAFKGLAALGFLLCGAAIWGALGRIAPERRQLGLYLWLWNPLALWESAGAGHNDAWMALFIVLAVWAFSKPRTENREPRTEYENKEQRIKNKRLRITQHLFLNLTSSPTHPFTRSLVAFLALTAGGLIKFLSLFLGPLFLGAALRRLPGWRARVQLVLVAGLACLAFAALAYAPFWAGWATFRNIGDRVALFTATWLATLKSALVARGVGQGLAQQIATTIGLWLLLGGTGWAAWRAWRAPERIAAHALWLFLWFLFVCNTWFQPWYLFWPLALAALQPWRTRTLVAVGLLCCTAMLGCYVAWSFLRPQLGWDVESARWNALLCVLIYVPPLLALGAGARSRGLLAGGTKRPTVGRAQLPETYSES